MMTFVYTSGEVEIPHYGTSITSHKRPSEHWRKQGVEWDNEANFDPEVLYSKSEKIKGKSYSLTNIPRASAVEALVKYKKNKLSSSRARRSKDLFFLSPLTSVPSEHLREPGALAGNHKFFVRLLFRLMLKKRPTDGKFFPFARA